MGLCASQLNALQGTSNRERTGSRQSHTKSVGRPVYCPEPVTSSKAFTQDCGSNGTTYTAGPCNNTSAVPSGAQIMGNHVYDTEPVVFPNSGYQSNYQNFGYQGKEVIGGVSNNLINPVWEASTSATKPFQPTNIPKSLTAAVPSTDVQNTSYQRSVVANGGIRLGNHGNTIENRVADVVPGYQSAPMIADAISRVNGDFQIKKGTGLTSQPIGYPVGRATDVGAKNFSNAVHRSAFDPVIRAQNFGSQMPPNSKVIYNGFQSRGLQNTSYPIRGIGYGVQKAKANSCSLCETVDPFERSDVPRRIV